MTGAGTPVDTPPPAERPRYVRAPGKVGRTWTVEDAIDGTFFLVGAVLVLWLGWVLVARELTFSWLAIVTVAVFWLLVAYVGLPRLQEVLARIYVPDYFIGRTVTGIGVLGDPVNLALDGSEQAMNAAMRRAGWTRADEVTLRSSWGIVVSSALRRSYPAAPVSPLLLFGRRQAFAYEQEVDGNASQRHHVRFWPVPEGWRLPGGQRVEWLAAGTYDRAVGLSLFTLQVTHKVDADIDVERDFVIATVRYACPEARLRVIADFATAFHTRNGGGDVVHTDGGLPILDLTGLGPAPEDAAPTPPDAPVAASPRLPPPALLLSGGLSASKAALSLVGLLVALLGGPRARWLPDVATAQLVVLGAGAGLIVVLWLLTLRRLRWARTLLMAVCGVEASTQLAALSGAGHVSLLLVATTGIAVLILIAVSSTEARRWVRDGRSSAAGHPAKPSADGPPPA
ncbi:LssY C-terminal domain-containing protein [Patulibacter sp. NPDC049589]|uniref:LssY C-terminal domain-containing protein n=1 Tax=Patulibacter sp. NPDC049589 TaxID=3154731 RepID=UPI0034179491